MSKMLKLSVALLLNFFAIVFAPDPENGSSQILPLVLFLSTSEHRDLYPPDTLETSKVVMVNGLIRNGTNFTLRVPAQQMFFCPKENTNENCLEPREFQGEEPLQCAIEATPVISVDSTITPCGPDRSGRSHDFVYKFCPGQEPYISRTRQFSIYTFCYDDTNEKTLFTQHYIISPKLLSAEALLRERLVKYPITPTAGFTPSIKVLPPQIDTSAYEQQKLVPFEDMAFALWRKPTSQDVNVDWQHVKLKPIWDGINHYIRLAAETLFATSRTRIYAKTGVFQLSPAQSNSNQLSNVWVKILYTMSENPKDNSMSGTAILMNNFVDGANLNSNSNELETIDSYCDNKNYTAELLTTEVKRAKGKIRFCFLNSKIKGLFGEEESPDTESPPMLHIPEMMKPVE